ADTAHVNLRNYQSHSSSEQVASMEKFRVREQDACQNADRSACCRVGSRLLWMYRHKGKRLAMVAPIFSHGLQSEQVGNAIVVTFTASELLDELTIQRVGDQLLRMAAGLGRRYLLVNLAGVHRLSTMMLGKLITLHKVLRSIGG